MDSEELEDLRSENYKIAIREGELNFYYRLFARIAYKFFVKPFWISVVIAAVISVINTLRGARVLELDDIIWIFLFIGSGIILWNLPLDKK